MTEFTKLDRFSAGMPISLEDLGAKDLQDIQQLLMLKSYMAELCARQGDAAEQRAQIAEQKAQASEELSYRDPLTGIANRRRVEEFLEVTHRAGPLGLLFIDIDNFKKFNDEHGHDVGDAALKHVVHCLQMRREADHVGRSEIHRTHYREAEQVGRFGGEEFLIVVPGCNNPVQICKIGEATRKSVEDIPFIVDDKIIPLTISVGCTVSYNTLRKKQELIDDADKALYASKHRGRNCVTIKDHTIKDGPIKTNAEFFRLMADNTFEEVEAPPLQARKPDPASGGSANKTAAPAPVV